MCDMGNDTKTKSKNNSSKGWIRENLSILISLALVVVMLLTVVSPLGLFTAHDAPFQLLAACLGAIVTVLITSLLLKSQAKQQHELQQEQAKTQEDLQDKAKSMELRQIKETEQYKAKLKIYQEYLVNLYEAVKDRELTTEEKIQMQFQTARLAMHTKIEHIEQVSTSVKDIIDSLTTPSGDKYDVGKLQKALFNIIKQFREELYENDSIGESNYSLIIQNFVDVFTPEGNDLNPEIDDDTNNLMSNGIWSESVKKWTKDDKWRLFVDGETIRLNRPGNTDIHIKFGFGKSHYYIQAKYHQFSDFSQALKRSFKCGTKVYETWWQHIPEFYDLTEGTFWKKFSHDENMQNILTKWFEKLKEFIEKWDVLANRFNELMNIIDKHKYEQQGWKFWIYWYPNDSSCVVCDYNNKDYGKPYIDTLEEDGKIKIRFYNREDNKEKMQNLLNKTGYTADAINKPYYIELDSNISDSEIMKKVAELIKKINKN